MPGVVAFFCRRDSSTVGVSQIRQMEAVTIRIALGILSGNSQFLLWFAAWTEHRLIFFFKAGRALAPGSGFVGHISGCQHHITPATRAQPSLRRATANQLQGIQQLQVPSQEDPAAAELQWPGRGCE